MINSFVYLPNDAVALPAADKEFVFGAGIPTEWALTRETAALGRGTDGRWTSYAANTPRPYHHPSTLTNLGTLLEPSRTQLVYSSRPLVLTPKSATRTEDATVQTPFGLGCTKLADNITNASHGLFLTFGAATSAVGLPDNATVSLQLTFRPFGGLTRGQIIATTKSGVDRTVEFSTAGTTPSILSNAMTSALIEPDTDGFFLLKCTVNFGTGTTTPTANLYFRLDDGTRVYSGDGTKGFFIAHYGAEIGDECTSPIVSTGASVARAEDVLASQGAWLARGPKSLGIQYTPLAASRQVILNASGEDGIEFWNDANEANYSLLAGGQNIGPLIGTAPAAGVERTNVLTAASNLFWLAQDGKKLAFRQEGGIPTTISSVRIGGRVGGGFAGPMLLRQVKYWREGLDREAAAAFSADITIPGIVPVLPVIDVQAGQTIPPETSSIALTVTLSGEPSGATVSYRTVDGTAVAGVDYTATTGTVTFQPGESVGTIPISLLTRSLIDTRTFRVELFAPGGAVLGTGTCVISLTKSAPVAHAPLKYVSFDGPLSSDWLLTRSTPGYARDSAGVWRSVPAGQPRIHFTAAGKSGVLIEPAAEQRMFDSVTGYYLANSTQSTDTTTATPTGNRSLIWRETASTGTHTLRAFWTNTAVDWPTGDLTFWMIVKPVGPRTLYRMLLKGIDNVYTDSRFDLSGAGSVTGGTTAAIHRIEQEPMAPGWYRIGVSRTQAASAGVTPEFSLGPIDAAGNPSLVGDVTYGFDMCHAQLELGLLWTSPIPVQAATAKTVRDADVLAAAGAWHKWQIFAVGANFSRLVSVPANQRIVQLRDPVPSTDDFGLLTAAGTLRATLTAQGSFVGDINGPVNAVGAETTAIVSIDTTRYALFTAGMLSGEISMAGKAMPDIIEQLRFGSRVQDASQSAPIVLYAMAYWTVGLSNEEGAVFSADLSGTPPGQVEPDALPLINVPATLSVNEGEALQIPVTKVGNGACSVRLVTKAQTASFGADYTGIDVTVTFAANETTKLVTVQTATDTDPNEINEKFGYSVSVIANPPDCQLGNAVGVATIIDQTVAPTSYDRAVGFATEVNCGEGRAWYRVTNLNDSGAGSLRDAMSVGNRHVVFDVGGTIMLASDLNCNVNNITVSGETAPAPGILIQKYQFITRGSNQRFSHLTFEKGHDNSDYGVNDGDVVKLSPGSSATWTRSNVHFDHCLFLWGQDEIFNMNPRAGGGGSSLSNISLTNCVFSEPLWHPSNYNPAYREHVKVANGTQGDHNYSLLFGRGLKNVDAQYCLFQDSAMRHPFLDCEITAVLANNIAHNCRVGATVQHNPNPVERMLVTCRGYLCISGPNSNAQSGFRWNTYVNPLYPGTRACVSNLYGWKGGSSNSTYITPGTAVQYGTPGVPYCMEGGVRVPVEVSTPPIDIPGNPVVAVTADAMYSRACANVGPLPKIRSRHALRVVNKLVAKSSQWVNHELEVGGRTAPVRVDRPLSGSTAFPDGTPIAAPPATATGATAPTATQINAAKAWINEFRKRVQYDYD